MKSPLPSVVLTFLCLGHGSASGQNLTQSTPTAGGWIISETASPVDYSPVVIATTRSQERADGTPMELSAYCRAGRTYLVLTGQNISGRGENCTISYWINGGSPTQAGTCLPLFGGAAMPGDVVRLLQSLPDDGEITFHLTTKPGPTREEIFSLSGLKTAKDKLAAACSWPPNKAKLHN